MAGAVLRWVILAALLAAVALLAWAGGRRAAPGRMGMLQHVAELRTRLLHVAAWLMAGTAFAFSFRLDTWRYGWLPRPALQENLAAQLFGVAAARLVPPGVELVVLRPMDAVMAELTVALGVGLVLALPALLVHGARFFSPALNMAERRALRSAIVPSLLLFVAGAAFAWLVVLPFLLVTLYGYAGALGAIPYLGVADFISFVVGLVVVFGVAFQTPLVMVALARAGVASSRTYLRFWRHSLVAILVLSAAVTDPTVVSQVLVAVPLFGLYLAGAFLARLVEPRGQLTPASGSGVP